jgi:CheY-like chemotaxis protein
MKSALKPQKEFSFSEMRVMIADDQPESRSMMRAMLTDMGVTQIYEAGDGRDALNFIDVAPDMIDIVICDWNMPKMTGIELLRQLRSVWPNTPFLMVTGRKDLGSISEAKASGVSAYIAKPFSPAQLEVKLRVLMQQKKAETKA